jgi:hypothetical protein
LKIVLVCSRHCKRIGACHLGTTQLHDPKVVMRGQ